MLERLRNILKERGLTLKAFADLSGISQSNLSNYINGNISPTLETLDKIAKSLDLEVQDLFPDKQKQDIKFYAVIGDKKYQITESDILKIIKEKNGETEY